MVAFPVGEQAVWGIDTMKAAGSFGGFNTISTKLSVQYGQRPV
jgi:hypothetical protein